MTELSCNFPITLLSIVLGYILGSIPFGLLITKFAGFGDIRNYGSGNIGATNVVRKAGKFWGLLTLLADGGKGALAVFLTEYICLEASIYAGLAAIIGHIFPIWLQFKGGKAVATSLAVFLMFNFKFGLMVCGVWLITFLITRISSLAAIMAFILAPIMASFLDGASLVISSSLISVLVIFRHKDNIKKLISRTENKF